MPALERVCKSEVEPQPSLEMISIVRNNFKLFHVKNLASKI
jgi:hypothetical protein